MGSEMCIRDRYVYYSYCKYFHTLVGKYEWSFGKRGLGMTQEVLGALPELGIRAGRAVLRWNKASRLMRRKTSTDMVKFESGNTKNAERCGKVSVKVAVMVSTAQHHHGNLCPIPSRITFRPHHANNPRQNDAAGEDIAGPSRKEQTDAARRRARQSIREYGLIGLLRQRLRAVSWPHWRLRCMQPLHGHGMGVVRP